MKKVFIQILQWILKHKKRLIYCGLAFFISQFFLFNIGEIGIGNEVYADGEQRDTATQNVNFYAEATKKFQEFAFIQKMIYLLIYPMLVIAGSLVDNSLVYGEVFGFDVALWELWNIMRNLANFTLGFIFVYKIFKYVFPGKKKEDMKVILRSLLIAGLGIQASWFIMAALIDVSTILAYGIGGLPISVLKDASTTGNNEKDKKDASTTGNNEKDKKDNPKNNPYILKTVINADVDDIDIVHIYLTNTPGEGHTPGEEHYISECETVTYNKEDLLLAPKMIYYEKPGGKFIKTESQICHYGGQVYQFYENSCEFEACNGKEDCKARQTDYQGCLNTEKTKIAGLGESEVIGKISEASLLEQGNAHITGGSRGGLWNGVYDKNLGLDANNENVGKRWGTKRLNEILDGESYVGIFTQLYSSLIRTGQGIITNAGEYSKLLATAISLGHLIAIGIPLIVVGVVFMIRIGILWIAIAISPFIALFAAFKDLRKDIEDRVKFLNYFNLDKLIGIIFAPTLICLAISLSTVLVTIITNLDYQSYGGDKILGGLVNLDIAGVSAVIWRFVISIFGIAATRFLVWAAVESSKLGELGFIKSFKNLAESAIGSIPIVPIPGKQGNGVEFIGANTAFGLNGQRGMLTTIADKVQTEYNSKDNDAIEELINGGKKFQEAEENRASAYKSKLLQLPVPEIHANRATQPIKVGEKGNEIDYTFSNLNPKQQENIIEEINKIKEDDVRKAFGNRQKTVNIGNDTYTFDGNIYKKDEKTGK